MANGEIDPTGPLFLGKASLSPPNTTVPMAFLLKFRAAVLCVSMVLGLRMGLRE